MYVVFFIETVSITFIVSGNAKRNGVAIYVLRISLAWCIPDLTSPAEGNSHVDASEQIDSKAASSLAKLLPMRSPGSLP